MFPLLHNPKPGGMREAIKSAAPEGEQGMLNCSLNSVEFLRLLTKSTGDPPFPWASQCAGICQHMQAYASICQHFHRTLSLQNLANTDMRSTGSVSQASFVQHKLEDLQDSPQDPQHGPKMASTNHQNCIRGPQIGPSDLQYDLWDMQKLS